MKSFIAFFSILVLATLLFAVSLLGKNIGSATITVGDLLVTMEISTALLLLFGLFLVFYAVVTLVKKLTGIGAFKKRLSSRRRTRDFHKGLTEYAKGVWPKAREHFLRATSERKLAYLAGTYAARCALKQNDAKGTRADLCIVQKASVDEEMLLPLLQAELHIAEGQLDLAKNFLANMLEKQPQNVHVLELLVDLCGRLGTWLELEPLIPRIQALYHNQPQKRFETELEIGRARLAAIGKDSAAERDLNRAWSSYEEGVRFALQGEYASALVSQRRYDEAERLLKKAIEKSWNREYLDRYGQITGGNVQGRLRHAETWHRDRPKDPEILLCLGRLYVQSENWDQARRLLRESFRLSPTLATHRALLSIPDYYTERKDVAHVPFIDN